MFQDITHLTQNLVFTRSGVVWATFRLQALPYGFAPERKKKAVKAVHQDLFQAFLGEVVLTGLTASVDPASVAELMLDGVDIATHPGVRDEVLSTLDILEDLHLGTRAYWLAVPLKANGWDYVKSAFRAGLDNAGDYLGLNRPAPSDERIEQLIERSDHIEKLIPSSFNARPATVSEHIWMSLHHQQRGLGRDSRVPSATLHGDVTEEFMATGAAIPSTHIDEAGQTDEHTGRLRNPLDRNYVKVSSDGVQALPSYQVIQAVRAMPVGGLVFPGTEWLSLADSLPVDVDWTLRLTITSRELAKRQNMKAENTLKDQYFQREGDSSMTGHSSELDPIAEDMQRFQDALNRSERETKIHVTALFAVGGHNSQEALEKSQQVASFYDGMEINLIAPLGRQEDLWEAMQIGSTTNNTARSFHQLTTGRDLAAAIPLASTELGSRKGSLLAINISTARHTPVLLDLDTLITGNKTGSLAVCGELGAGKSVALKKIAGDTVDRDGQIIVADHSETMEWSTYANSLGNDNVTVEVANPKYSLDPLRLFGQKDGASAVESLVTTLMNISPTDDAGLVLSEAVDPDNLAENDITSLGVLLKYLEKQSDQPGSKDLVRLMKTFARRKLGRVIFDEKLPVVPLDCTSLVMCTRGTALPSRDELVNEHLFKQLSIEKIFGRSLYTLISHLSRHYCYRNRSTVAGFFIDEAHHVTVSPETVATVAEFHRECRKVKAFMAMGSHDPSTDFGNDTVNKLITLRILMRHSDRELAARGLKWLNLSPTDEDLLDMVTLDTSPTDENDRVYPGREGECIIGDHRQRYGRAQITRPALDERFAAIISTPGATVGG